jgi:hypothetical protein
MNIRGRSSYKVPLNGNHVKVITDVDSKKLFSSVCMSDKGSSSGLIVT